MAMLLMCHLFIGLVIGLVAFRYTGDRRMFLLAGIGSIIPDLIDKPLGHIILNGSLDYGRIYAHSGLFLLALVIVGLAYRERKCSWLMMVLALGVVSHLLMDSMWELPVTLFFPFQGDFGPHHFPNYVEESLVTELINAYEWMFGAYSLVTIMYVYRKKLGNHRSAVSDMAPRILNNLSNLLVVTGFLCIIFGLFSIFNPLSMTDNMGENLIIGAAALFGGVTTTRMWRSISEKSVN